MMDRYTQVIDSAISDFKRLFPQCYDFIQQDVDWMRNETFEAVKRYRADIEVLGYEKVFEQLERYLNNATILYSAGQDFLQPHNGRDYKSAASNILTGMLEIAWIKEFKVSYLGQNSMFKKDIDNAIGDRPSYLEIALLQYYTGVDVINEDKAAEIAESYGYVARYSGKKLKQVCDDNNQQNKIIRIGSPRHTNDKIKILEKIIDMLPDSLKSKAKQDLSTLKANSKNTYY